MKSWLARDFLGKKREELKKSQVSYFSTQHPAFLHHESVFPQHHACQTSIPYSPAEKCLLKYPLRTRSLQNNRFEGSPHPLGHFQKHLWNSENWIFSLVNCTPEYEISKAVQQKHSLKSHWRSQFFFKMKLTPWAVHFSLLNFPVRWAFLPHPSYGHGLVPFPQKKLRMQMPTMNSTQYLVLKANYFASKKKKKEKIII